MVPYLVYDTICDLGYHICNLVIISGILDLSLKYKHSTWIRVEEDEIDISLTSILQGRVSIVTDSAINLAS